ncbi:MAG TPA: hypothetical protein VL990_08605 [Acidobacteriaceae bacterium]|nr:hypothetical protein [Acidobacteriaceae bacterium]
MNQRLIVPILLFTGISGFPFGSYSQVPRADYDRALNLQKRYDSLPIDLPDNASWLPTGDRFVYRKSVEGGHEFVIVNAATQARQPAFDQARLATALSAASGKSYTALTLPFARFHISDDDSAIEFEADDTALRCDLHAWTCCGRPLSTGDDYGYDDTPRPENSTEKTLPSPDGKWLAYILNYNVEVRSKDGKEKYRLSHDGSEGNYYVFSTIAWSPDSTRLVAYRIAPAIAASSIT